MKNQGKNEGEWTKVVKTKIIKSRIQKIEEIWTLPKMAL